MTRLLALTVLLSAAGGAATGAARLECDDAYTTPAIERCLTRVRNREDSLLRSTERRVRARLDSTGVHRFDSATVAWERYRETECQSVYDWYTPGTIAPIEYLTCQIALARERRANLHELYNLDR